MVSTVTEGRIAQATSPRPTEASTPISAGPSSTPERSTRSPASMSSPARRMSLPGSTATRTATRSSPSSVSSTRITASAPAGIIAPVEILIASPGPSSRSDGWPARDSPTTSSRAGSPSAADRVSAPRSA